MPSSDVVFPRPEDPSDKSIPSSSDKTNSSHGEHRSTFRPQRYLCKKKAIDYFTQPKVRSQRSISRAHTASVKPVNRTFAAQDNAVRHVDVGALKDVSVRET